MGTHYFFWASTVDIFIRHLGIFLTFNAWTSSIQCSIILYALPIIDVAFYFGLRLLPVSYAKMCPWLRSNLCRGFPFYKT